MKRRFGTLSMILLFLLASNGAFSLTSEDILLLKKKGVSDETIRIMVREKSKETCSFAVEDVLRFKDAGLSEETIQMLITESSFMKNVRTIVYGKDTKPLKFTTVKDIIELKEAGLSEEVIQAIIIFASEKNDEDRMRAWDMLRSMGIIIDMRKGSQKNDRSP